MNVFSAVLLVVFAVIGAAAVIREISLRLFSYKGDCSVLLVTPVSESDDVEFVLRSAISTFRWRKRCCGCGVCLDCEISESTRKVCETICREYGVKLISRDEFIKLLRT